MAKLPWFPFFPGDWIRDPNLRRCSDSARGVWMDVLCLMHESEDRGVLVTGGQPWGCEDICAALGDRPSLPSLITELTVKGVLARSPDGAYYSRRMVRDEQVRRERIKAGGLGGKAKGKQKPSKTQAKLKQTLYDSEYETDSDLSKGVKDTGGVGGASQGGAVSLALERLPAAFKTDGFRVAWEGWADSRASGGHRLTGKAVSLAMNKLIAWGPDKAIQALTDATIGGWRGLFEPKENQSGGRNQGGDADRRRRDQRAKEFPEPERPLPRL